MASKLLARIRLIARFAGYGASPIDSCRILIAYMRAWILPKFGRSPQRAISARVRLYGRTLPVYFRQFCDFCVFEEIFIKEEYKKVENPRHLPIIDAGANVGFTALYFAFRFPNVPIYAFEPDPGAFRLLCLNTQTLPQIHPIAAALGDTDGTATFYSVPGSAMSSSFVHRDRGEAVSVVVRSLSSWMRENTMTKVGVLKIDVEGFEDRILEGIEDTGQIDEYIAEVHFDLMDKDEAWFAKMLAAHTTTFTSLSATRAILYARRT